MTLDLRSALDGFSEDLLKVHLEQIQDDSRYTYYTDVLRAFLSSDSEEVQGFQADSRILVANAASCNPKADLAILQKNIKKFALMTALNPALDQKLLNVLQKSEHPAIPVFLSANSYLDPELKVFAVLAHDQANDIDEDSIDSWFEHSLDGYEDSPTQAIAEINQLLTLELLGFFKEGGEFPFWQMLEDIDLEPTDKLWKALASLPRVPKEIYSETPVTINIHVARELSAEKSLTKDLLEELLQDDCCLGDEINNSDTWFATRSPRASVAFSNYAKEEILTQIIEEEIAFIEGEEDYQHGQMGVLWRIAGNGKLKKNHFETLKNFATKSIARCSDEMFVFDLIGMLEGGPYVDLPLLANEGLSTGMKAEFELLIEEIKKAGKK